VRPLLTNARLLKVERGGHSADVDTGPGAAVEKWEGESPAYVDETRRTVERDGGYNRVRYDTLLCDVVTNFAQGDLVTFEHLGNLHEAREVLDVDSTAAGAAAVDVLLILETVPSGE
jgi:hypothetical protein